MSELVNERMSEYIPDLGVAFTYLIIHLTGNNLRFKRFFVDM